MLNANMETLGDDSLSHLLVDNDSNSPGVDVEDATSTSVVELVWHALMD